LGTGPPILVFVKVEESVVSKDQFLYARIALEANPNGVFTTCNKVATEPRFAFAAHFELDFFANNSPASTGLRNGLILTTNEPLVFGGTINVVARNDESH